SRSWDRSTRARSSSRPPGSYASSAACWRLTTRWQRSFAKPTRQRAIPSSEPRDLRHIGRDRPRARRRACRARRGHDLRRDTLRTASWRPLRRRRAPGRAPRHAPGGRAAIPRAPARWPGGAALRSHDLCRAEKRSQAAHERRPDRRDRCRARRPRLHARPRLRRARRRRGRARVSADPEPALAVGPTDWASGESGIVGGVRLGVRTRVDDALLDARRWATLEPPRLARAARRKPPHTLRVLAIGVEREDRANLMPQARAELQRSRHDVELATCGVGGRGKFEN